MIVKRRSRPKKAEDNSGKKSLLTNEEINPNNKGKYEKKERNYHNKAENQKIVHSTNRSAGNQQENQTKLSTKDGEGIRIKKSLEKSLHQSKKIVGLTGFNDSLGQPIKTRNNIVGKDQQVGQKNELKLSSKTSFKKNNVSQFKISKNVDQILAQELMEQKKQPAKGDENPFLLKIQQIQSEKQSNANVGWCVGLPFISTRSDSEHDNLELVRKIIDTGQPVKMSSENEKKVMKVKNTVALSCQKIQPSPNEYYKLEL
jgi:hypothetical protein